MYNKIIKVDIDLLGVYAPYEKTDENKLLNESCYYFLFAIMSWCVGFNEFMPYAILFEAHLEQCGRGIFSIAKPFCKF